MPIKVEVNKDKNLSGLKFTQPVMKSAKEAYNKSQPEQKSMRLEVKSQLQQTCDKSQQKQKSAKAESSLEDIIQHGQNSTRKKMKLNKAAEVTQNQSQPKQTSVKAKVHPR